MSGRVFIVGAGPGDIELITLKGYNALRNADCVLYDFLSNIRLLDYCKPECEKICVGKSDGIHLLEQDEINDLLVNMSKKHDFIVRLKGGDPFIFSRGIEEARHLKENEIEYEVIPGVTSAIAGPESVGIPLTIKNKYTSLGIVTGRLKDPEAEIEAPDCKTLVYLMGVKNIKNIIKALRKRGRADDTPCMFIERTTLPESRMIFGTIGTIEEITINSNVKAPAVLLVGEVINHAIN